MVSRNAGSLSTGVDSVRASPLLYGLGFSFRRFWMWGEVWRISGQILCLVEMGGRFAL
jgi:hypothetical protein